MNKCINALKKYVWKKKNLSMNKWLNESMDKCIHEYKNI